MWTTAPHTQEVRDLLYDVRHVEASYGAFAALCGAEGRVVTWGNPLYGGRCRAWQNRSRRQGPWRAGHREHRTCHDVWGMHSVLVK